jgi:hypothetical protein
MREFRVLIAMFLETEIKRSHNLVNLTAPRHAIAAALLYFVSFMTAL